MKSVRGAPLSYQPGIHKQPRQLLRTAEALSVLFGICNLPAHSATIVVWVGCTLADAIDAANTDAPAGGCPAGSEADVVAR